MYFTFQKESLILDVFQQMWSVKMILGHSSIKTKKNLRTSFQF